MTTQKNSHSLYTQVMDDADFRAKLTGSESPQELVAALVRYVHTKDIPASSNEAVETLNLAKDEHSDQELE